MTVHERMDGAALRKKALCSCEDCVRNAVRAAAETLAV